MPANVNQILGVKKVVANMRRHYAKIALQHEAGLKAAGLVFQGESQRLVPIDTGNLRASAFTRKSGSGFNVDVNVGYTANYALFVHEAPMTLKGQKRQKPSKGRYWDPQGRATNRFMTKAIDTNKAKALAIYQRITGRGY